MRNDKVAVIGDKDLVTAFKAVGMDVYEAITAEQAQTQLKKLAMNYPLIFITEDLALEIEDFIARYRAETYPIIIPIPSSSGGNGYGLKGVEDDFLRAIGTNLLDNISNG